MINAFLVQRVLTTLGIRKTAAFRLWGHLGFKFRFRSLEKKTINRVHMNQFVFSQHSGSQTLHTPESAGGLVKTQREGDISVDVTDQWFSNFGVCQKTEKRNK